MATKKTRIVANVGGKPRIILSVNPYRKTDINIVRQDEEYRLGGPRVFDKENENSGHKMSLHWSPDSPDGITIMSRSATAAVNEESLACFVKGGKKELMFPFFAMSCPDLTDDRYELTEERAKRTKRLETIARNVPPWSTLCLYLFAATFDREPPEFDDINVRVLDDQSTQFRLVLYWNYLNFPSSPFGVTTGIGTSNKRENGKEVIVPGVGPLTGGGGTSIPDHLIPTYFAQIYTQIAARLSAMAHRAFEQGFRDFRPNPLVSIQYTKWPLPQISFGAPWPGQ